MPLIVFITGICYLSGGVSAAAAGATISAGFVCAFHCLIALAK